MSLSCSSSTDMFSPSLASYDLLIHLKPLQVPARHLALTNILENKHQASVNNDAVKTIPILSHDNVEHYVSLLSQCYGHLAQFYHDRYGGTVIGVKLIKHDDAAESVKVKDIAGHSIITDGGKVSVEVNYGAIIEDWKILGHKLVKDVEILKCDILQ